MSLFSKMISKLSTTQLLSISELDITEVHSSEMVDIKQQKRVLFSILWETADYVLF